MGSGLSLIGKQTFISSSGIGSGEISGLKEIESQLERIKVKYPRKKSAIMPALYIAQEYFGFVSKEAIAWVSGQLDLPPAHVESVATFYTMYYKRPVGRYHIQVCRTLSCMLCGAKELTSYLKDRLRVGAGEPTKDGLWSWEEVECLGSCGTAPMVEINDVFFENLTPELLGKTMDLIEKEKPDLRFHAGSGTLGSGLPDHSRSQVI
ncbi:MAG TPA: NAD(P)H-dependent oxidoreductase subunit E [Oligoflexia bacterium]|nr:NAD(P)H-dependent oxidoreductase subunit E [Oligoflexia bacterium]HMP47888.1 NAD(P)H-dependent oxidoreductase subunit E [Oligoflexia bacterium]